MQLAWLIANEGWLDNLPVPELKRFLARLAVEAVCAHAECPSETNGNIGCTGFS